MLYMTVKIQMTLAVIYSSKGNVLFSLSVGDKFQLFVFV